MPLTSPGFSRPATAHDLNKSHDVRLQLGRLRLPNVTSINWKHSIRDDPEKDNGEQIRSLAIFLLKAEFLQHAAPMVLSPGGIIF